MNRRTYGTGSIFQRSSDGRWIATAELPRGPGEPRRRKVLSGRTREEAQAKLDAWYAANPGRQRTGARVGRRTSHMANARALGTHTAEQWREKVAGYHRRCHYCGRDWMLVLHKDHVVPVSRGGSDGLDNVVPACADCNAAKGDSTAEEFLEWAELVGFFGKPRQAQVLLGGKVRRMPREGAIALRDSLKRRGRRLIGVIP